MIVIRSTIAVGSAKKQIIDIETIKLMKKKIFQI